MSHATCDPFGDVFIRGNYRASEGQDVLRGLVLLDGVEAGPLEGQVVQFQRDRVRGYFEESLLQLKRRDVVPVA